MVGKTGCRCVVIEMSEKQRRVVRDLVRTFKPDKVGIALGGLVSIGIGVGMAIAQKRLMVAGLVEAEPAAEALALPGFVFVIDGGCALLGAHIYAIWLNGGGLDE